MTAPQLEGHPLKRANRPVGITGTIDPTYNLAHPIGRRHGRSGCRQGVRSSASLAQTERDRRPACAQREIDDRRAGPGLGERIAWRLVAKLTAIQRTDAIDEGRD